MLRREVARRDESALADTAARSVLFVGPAGRGVGLAADILADAARLAHRRVHRRRSVSTAAGSPGSATGTLSQLVKLHVAGVRSRNSSAHNSSLAAQAMAVAEPADVVVAWDRF